MLDWLGGYRKEWLRPDLIAGLTTGAVVIPKAMAYATVAGLPVQVPAQPIWHPLLIPVWIRIPAPILALYPPILRLPFFITPIPVVRLVLGCDFAVPQAGIGEHRTALFACGTLAISFVSGIAHREAAGT